MKRFIQITAVVLPLFVLGACNPSKAPEANVTSASPGASTATITASPNPVPAGEGAGTTTISWNTADGSAGQIYVSVDGEPETLFGTDASGSVPAPWIKAEKMYEFRLYAGTQHATVLAKTQVAGQK